MDDETKQAMKAEKLKKAREKAKLVREQKKKREMDALAEEVKKESVPPPEPAPELSSSSDSSDEEIVTITIKKKVFRKPKVKWNRDIDLNGLINWAGNFQPSQ